MRIACIPVLLFAAYICAWQPHLSAHQPHASLLIGNLLRIADGQQRFVSAVTICLETDPNPLIVGAAEMLANEMFAGIRVRLHWYEPPVCPAGAGQPVLMMLETATPAADHPGALGVALPREGSHAWVFYDRVMQSHRGDHYVAALLGHVMAHEIAHVLQGINRHSESGILKANWSPTDCARMAFLPLTFTREDSILIHQGLEERRSRLVSNSSTGIPADRASELSVPVRASWPVPKSPAPDVRLEPTSSAIRPASSP
jgi:hypothetical protein